MRTVVAVAFGLATAAVAFGVGTEHTSVAIADLTALGAAIVATAAALRARRVTPGRHGWTALSVALGLWALGEALWTTWEVVLGDEVPYPSIADIAYLGAVPFAVAGLLRFVPASARRFGIRSLLDGCLIGGSTLFVGWALALGPAVRGDGETPLAHAITIAYPLTDVVLAALAVLVLQWGATNARRSLQLVAIGFVLMAVADTAFTWMITQGTYAGDGLVTMLWPASYLAIAAAASADERALAPRSSSTWTASTSVLAVLLPFIPLAAAVAIGVTRLSDGKPFGPFLGAVGFALVVLVLARQTVMAWELRSTVVALHEREDELARMAHTDALTGLANRARLGERLELAVTRRLPRPAVVYVDIDGFKGVNDTYGHAVGDRLLAAAADRLAAAATPSMLVSRLGGDEFVVLVEDGHGEAVRYAQRVVDAFRVPFHTEGAVICFQASVGVAIAPIDGNADEAVRRADAAMYVAKTTGKGRAVDYPDEAILTV